MVCTLSSGVFRVLCGGGSKSNGCHFTKGAPIALATPQHNAPELQPREAVQEKLCASLGWDGAEREGGAWFLPVGVWAKLPK